MSVQPPGPPPAPPPLPPPLPPPAPPGPPAGPQGGSPFSWKTLAIVFLAVIVALGVVVAVVVAGGGDDEAAAAEVTLEPVSTSGDNPFMPSVGKDEDDVKPPAQAGGKTFNANTPGLYGGTLNQASCDAAQMVAFLQGNPDKARAWANALGITAPEISAYVNELTPVILRADVAVTNHGFRNGRANEIPAILQAGTAVLVDKYGFPTVKCYCGNPLTRPQVYTNPTYTGTRWPGFAPPNITIIQPTTVIIDTFTLVDPRTGESFTRPRGSNGSQDQPETPPPSSSTSTTTLPPPTATTQPAGPTPEERASAKVDDASQACYPFPAPIEDSTSSTKTFEPGSSANSFVLQVTTQTVDGGTQVYRWEVDRSTIAFTPINDLAQVASGHCAQLN